MSNLNSLLYPEVEPFRTEFLAVSELHKIYFEECGNPNGKPVLFVHGGPGGGIQPHYRRYFNPEIYRIILVDQRGCGKSLPHAETRENTTQLLISDFEKIRILLNISKWQVFGGSWGSTLALAYAEAHPEVISELVLRGVFLGRPKELDWMYQWGCSEVFPEAWANFIKIIPEEERSDFRLAYHKRLTSVDQSTRYQAAQAWSVWEGSISKLFYDPEMLSHYGDPEFALAFARIENHYFMNHLFFTPNQLLNEVHKIRHIPTFIVHGRYDMCCPVTNAWELHQVFPESELYIIPDAGHSISEIGTAKKLMEITNRLGGVQAPLNTSVTPQDILPDGIDSAMVNGKNVRKGTVAAFLANVEIWENPASSTQVKADAMKTMKALAEGVVALQLPQYVTFKNPEIEALLTKQLLG